jgi:nitrogen regulatory protein PII-like uncharacterized protein
MRNKISTVKNPLTVIAIFAGTAEISGTAILPLLEVESQQIYIWFLMLFPLLLIVFFFLTLNWNHKVLYAPSDFSNEDNFVNILKKPTIQETLTNIENDLKDSEEEINDKESTKTNDKLEKNIKSTTTTEAAREKNAKLVRNINRQRMQEIQMAELWVLNKLEKELDVPIQREMMLKVGSSKIIFDGVAQVGTRLTGIEIKYMRNRNSINSSMWENLFHRFESLYHSLNDTQKRSFSVIFAIVTDEDLMEIKEHIKKKMERLSFPVDIRVYDFDNLRNETIHYR